MHNRHGRAADRFAFRIGDQATDRGRRDALRMHREQTGEQQTDDGNKREKAYAVETHGVGG